MHELAHRGAIRSRMHSDPQCRVNALVQQGNQVVDGTLLLPPTQPPSYSLSLDVNVYIPGTVAEVLSEQAYFSSRS